MPPESCLLTLGKEDKLITCLVFWVCFSKMSSQLCSGPKFKQKLNSCKRDQPYFSALKLGYAPYCLNSICQGDSWTMQSKHPRQQQRRACLPWFTAPWSALKPVLQHLKRSFLLKHPASYVLPEIGCKCHVPKTSLLALVEWPVWKQNGFVIGQENPCRKLKGILTLLTGSRECSLSETTLYLILNSNLKKKKCR